MGGDDTRKENNNINKTNNSLVTLNRREYFSKWLSEGNASKSSAYSTKMLLSTIDVASDYAVEEGLSDIGIWNCSSKNDFIEIYNNLTRDDMFRLTDFDVYRCFISAGRLFSEFINLPKPIKHEVKRQRADKSLESEFKEWINATYSNKAYNEKIISFIHSISDYAIKSGICNEGLWSIHDIDSIRPVLKKLRDTVRDPFLKMGVGSNGFANSLRVYFRFISERQPSENPKISTPTLIEVIKGNGKSETDISLQNTDSIDNVKQTIISILEQYFPNGIRPQSVIDTNRLKKCFLEATGDNISSKVEDIPNLLTSLGYSHNDKVYFVSAANKASVRELFDRIFEEGNRMVFYSEVYEANAILLQNMNVFSVPLLQRILAEIKPTLYFRAKYCSSDAGITLEQEVSRNFESSPILTLDNIKERLPYIPSDSIRQVLARVDDFIRVEAATYTHLSRVALDNVECEAACNMIDDEIAEKGYATLAYFDFSHSIAMNGAISLAAIKSVFFLRYLADKFERRGNIVTYKDTPLNYKEIIKDYCLSLDRVTLDELLSFEEELAGKTHSMSLFVANDIMVRVSRDEYVSERLIDFDAETIDDALERFMGDGVIPLQAVTSFTTFPLVEGYVWNWFMLESYCRRFSHSFMYQCLSVNSKNVGAIFRKSLDFTDYYDVLAYVAARANIVLTIGEVGNFLFNKRYIAKRTNTVQLVIEKARKLLEER